jgi:hypothetical protein
MAEIISFRSKTASQPTTSELVAKVRQLKSDNSENMHWEHPHFQQRLQERKISMRQVLDVIENGEPMGTPKQDKWGDWRIKLSRKTAGRRVQVVIAVKQTHFVIITVI